MDGLPDVSARTKCRIGRSPGGTKASGLSLVFPACEQITPMVVPIHALEVPTQIVATCDDVSVKVDGAIYFRVIDDRLALLCDPGFLNSVSKLAQTLLRCAVEGTTLDELLSRVNLHVRLHSIVDRHVAVWGMKVTLVEVNHIEIEVNPASVWIAGAVRNLRELEPLRNSDESPWPKQ